ncbi:MAG TPA: hypothetical protein VHP37_02275 [Burkholderiales bacterium]|nr:hypothetical protein [Burkholderiales bacterium]
MLLLALGVAVQQLPLEVTRPSPSHVLREGYPTLQKVPARLWEDPFDAIAGQTRRGGEQSAGKARPRETLLTDVSSEIEKLGRKAQCVSIMPVTVFGGPFGEYSEVRRRTRHAVVSGLLRSGFSALDEDHLGYVRIGNDPGDGPEVLSQVIPFEWFERKAADAPNQAWRRLESCEHKERVLLLWLDEDNLFESPLRKIMSITEKFARYSADIDRVRLIGPAGSRTLEEMVSELNRYEQPKPAAPMDIAAAFVRAAYAPRDGSGANGNGGADTESSRGTRREPLWTYGAPLEIFVWGATTPPDEIKGSADRPAALQFANNGISIVRAAADDLSVIRRIKPELEQRGVVLGRDPIALVSESETSYGRQLTSLIKKEVLISARAVADRPQQVKEGDLVLGFNYFRGLDGETAFAAAQGAQARSEKDEKRKASERGETSSGLAQLDYARRIAAAVRERHNELRSLGSKIGAIGILGTDFYDKSLLLQALKKEMPQAVFFTTDLDARMTDENQTRWSRNLLVFSGLGLSLHPSLQGGIGPFRDAYQTSAFLSTLLAVNMRQQHPASQRPSDRDGIIHAVEASTLLAERVAPRAYEVGTREFFDYGPAVSANHVAEVQDDDCSAFNVQKCRTLYPKVSRFVQLEGVRSLLCAALILLGAAGLVYTTSRFARDKFGDAYARIRNPVLAMIVASFVALALWGLVLAWNDSIVREPFRWAEGYSAWPSLMLRYLAALLSVWFLYAVVKDHKHMIEVLGKFGLPTEPDTKDTTAVPWWLTRARQLLSDGSYLRRIDWSILRWARQRPEGPVNAVEVTRDYLVLASAERRWDRLWPVVSCYVIFGMSLVLLWDEPGNPVRGAGTRAFSLTLLVIYIAAYSFLLFAVVDAVRLFDAFVEKLMVADTKYAPATLQTFRAELNLREDPLVDRYLADWLDIKLFAEQTESTISLVYFPFVILAIWLIGRSQLFDAWYTPPSLAIIFLLGALYTAFATLRLRKTAERARSTAVDSMTRLLVGIRGRVAEAIDVPADDLQVWAGLNARRAAEDRKNEHLMMQLGLMLEQVKTMQRGAFMSLAQQPLWKAVLLPLSGFGGIELLQYIWMVTK